jgi:osmotically inducible protein OsmC
MIRHAEAAWSGDLKQGKGRIKVESGVLDTAYGYRARFEGGGETNPEELLGAALAACFSMALAAMLSSAGFPPSNIHTDVAVHLDRVGPNWTLTRIDLTTDGDVPGIDSKVFETHAENAKASCPVSRALAGVPEVHLMARLKQGTPGPVSV